MNPGPVGMPGLICFIWWDFVCLLLAFFVWGLSVSFWRVVLVFRFWAVSLFAFDVIFWRVKGCDFFFGGLYPPRVSTGVAE